ncbi:hypothetical protein ACFYNO_33255, partial [Kitasatospora sp. NPDC006697]|uniref:hypothetical protein n=1 Tax=Kitasatospora sp. NPDC006697 TaxID=3364020 RepID=UPI0036C885D3
MSTYLALTFGTLLSSQGTDTSFEPLSSGPSGRFVLSSLRAYQIRLAAFSDSLSVFPTLPGLPHHFGLLRRPSPYRT